jgi:oligopeptide transport system substrate-binding protein
MNLRIPLLFTALLVLFGCSKRETPVEIGNREQILHIGNGSEPRDLDPQTTTGNPESMIQDALFEGLTAWSYEHNDPVPGAAERWDISEDGKVYTFYIRPDAKWSNGDPLTAADFVFSYNRILSPNLSAAYAYMFSCVENAEAFNKGEITDFSKVGVKALDERTLQITLKAPTPYFLRMVRYRCWYPVHPPTILKFGKIDEKFTKWTHTGNHVGNGAFKLKSWATQRKVVLEKNQYFWDSQTVRLNEIHYYPIEDINSEENAYRSGQLHITREVPPSRIAYYKENYPKEIHLDPWLGTYFYEMNTTRPPMNDVRVRRALALALDRENIVKYVCKAGQPAAYHIVPPDTAGYHSEARIEYNVEEAKKLLAEAGYPNGEGFPKFQLLYNTHKAHMRLAEVVQQIWKENLNIEVELTNMEWKTFLQMQKDHQFDISRSSWIADYIDPSSFLDYFITDGGNNHSGWSNKQYDELIRQSAFEPDQEKRFEIFQQAEKLLLEEVPAIPIYFYRNKSLVHPSVKNWGANPLDRHAYKYVYLEANE